MTLYTSLRLCVSLYASIRLCILLCDFEYFEDLACLYYKPNSVIDFTSLKMSFRGNSYISNTILKAIKLLLKLSKIFLLIIKVSLGFYRLVYTKGEYSSSMLKVV